MSRKTKIILIVVGIIALIAICVFTCVVAFSVIMSSTYSRGNEIKEGILTDVCNSHGSFGDTEYKAWFTAGYRDDVHLLEAQDIISDAFPQEFDCKDLTTDGFIDMLKSGQSVNVSIVNGVSRATISIPKGDSEFSTFELKKVGTEWEIDSVAVTKSSGR
ncbi:MAG: hypothetical protein PHS44_01580 [Candidatus Dojkabacteria bacterium]|nr:hypothetical protein [Candidatus Dojkabacteria bacterium]